MIHIANTLIVVKVSNCNIFFEEIIWRGWNIMSRGQIEEMITLLTEIKALLVQIEENTST